MPKRTGVEASDRPPGNEGSLASIGFQKSSIRLPSGSSKVMRSATKRRSASARLPRVTATPAGRAGGVGVEVSRLGDLPAHEGEGLAGLVGDDEPLLRVVHAEGERLAAAVDLLHAEQAAGEVGPVVEPVGAHPEVAQGDDGHGGFPLKLGVKAAGGRDDRGAGRRAGGLRVFAYAAVAASSRSAASAAMRMTAPKNGLCTPIQEHYAE